MNARTQRAKQMMEIEGYTTQFNQNSFKVGSQADSTKHYIVSRTGNGLKCECKDHEIRKADCKHIKIVLKIIKQNKCYRNNKFRIMERAKLNLCKFCDSGNLKKAGMRKTKNGSIQRYDCLDCKKRFTTNFSFEKMRYGPTIITRAL